MRRSAFLYISSYAALAALLCASSARAALDTITPDDPHYAEQSYLQQIKAPDAWRITKGSRKVVVAVIDSGVQITHPDLQDNIWTNPGERYDGVDDDNDGYVDDVHGWDFINNKPNPDPDLDAPRNDLGFHHGTIVAGIIGAVANNHLGGAGINWRVSIMPLRALNGAGDSGDGEPVGVIKAIDYAIAHHADVINMSFVGSSASPEFVRAIYRADAAGITVVAAAGNENDGGVVKGNLDIAPRYPICIHGPNGEPWYVIGVGAVDSHNHKAVFSNFGSRCVDIMAPGVHMASTKVFEPTDPRLTELFGGDFSGTSIAAPEVTGAIALLKSIKPDLTPQEIYETLTSTADSIDNDNPLYKGELGAGIMNVARAVQHVAAMLPEPHLYLGSSGAPTVLKIDAQGVAQKKFVFNFGKPIGASIARARTREGTARIIAGSANTSSQIRIFDDTGAPVGPGFLAYPSSYKGGIRIAAGDVDGSGEDDIVTAPAGRYAPEVRVFSLDGRLKYSFLAYAPAMRFGMNVALADMDGGGIPDIVTVPLSGAPAHVRIFTGKGVPKNSGFFAYDKAYRGGVSLAVGDIDGTGTDRIVTVPVRSSAPKLKVFSADGNELRSVALPASRGSRYAVAAGALDQTVSPAIVAAEIGQRVSFSRFTPDLEPVAWDAPHISSMDFKNDPMLIIAP